MEVIAVTDDQGKLLEPEWLAQAERVHRQLRPHLQDYVASLHAVFADGVRMAIVASGSDVVCVALWRIMENVASQGRRFYVEDLVSDETQRSRGAGKRLLGWLENKARELGCGVMALDSGVHRHAAHRFYFREEMFISAYSFKKVLN